MLEKEVRNVFEELSAERKELQAQKKLPKWFTTMGWKAFSSKYLQEKTYEAQIERICKAVVKFAPKREQYYLQRRWKELFMHNHAYLSTPALANTGTDLGLPVSCAGSTIGDSVYDFYNKNTEAAILSKTGHGTSSLLGMRPRGAPYKDGKNKASGALPVIKNFVQMTKDVSQGTRRGAWAGYVDIEHGDFDEICDYVKANPDGANIGWNLTDSFKEKLERGDKEAVRRWKKAILHRMIPGRGYMLFIDKVNRARPEAYKKNNLDVKASNLCSEITLHSDEDHTFSCVLSGMVAETYDSWKGTDAVYCMTVFLDCLVSYYLEQGDGVRGLESIMRATRKGRALGLGLTGLHSLFQKKGFAFGDLQSTWLNKEIAEYIQTEAKKASQHLAKELGEPEWCKGTGMRNTHLTAYAPNVTSALIFGSWSEGISPWYGNVFPESGAAGGMNRINPYFIEVLKKHGKYNEEVLEKVLKDKGSVRSLDFLSEEEKLVLRTAFEIPQEDVLRLASDRQQHNCQAQSLNLHFSSDAKEEYVGKIHSMAYNDPNILSLYYVRTESGVQTADGCTSCAS